MSGFCGYFSVLSQPDFPQQTAENMVAKLVQDGDGNTKIWAEAHSALAIVSDDADYSVSGPIQVAVSGHPYWKDAAITQVCEKNGPAAAIIEAYRKCGADVLGMTQGDFSIAIIDENDNSLLLAIDRIGIAPLAYSLTNDCLVFGSTADAVCAHPLVSTDIDEQSIYNYLYFHMVPSPGSIYNGQKKLLPAQYLVYKNGQIHLNQYWRPAFNEKKLSSQDLLAEELMEVLRGAIRNCSPTNDTGAFLSGGVDSSTVAGLLSEINGNKTRAYSIGFDAKGYDEIEYARITANHFGIKGNEYYVTPEDVHGAIIKIAKFYDEPYGNSSAIPAYYCACFAKSDGIQTMLAGDGGDELFAGNERYAKQKIFEFYSKVPGSLRNGLIEPLLSMVPKNVNIPLISKIQSYVDQAVVPLPARLETYNFFHREPLENILKPDFLASINPDDPINMMSDVYNGIEGATTLNRMLFLDWKQTLADNDLRKVNKMCELGGVKVRYPLLDDGVLEFSTTIPSALKMKNNKLRYFFKQAVSDFLPREIITKPKHGFGLPFGVWLSTAPLLQEMAYDNVSDFRKRAYINGQFIDWLIDEHREGHAAFYGIMIWVIMMLEIWLKEHKHG